MLRLPEESACCEKQIPPPQAAEDRTLRVGMTGSFVWESHNKRTGTQLFAGHRSPGQALFVLHRFFNLHNRNRAFAANSPRVAI